MIIDVERIKHYYNIIRDIGMEYDFYLNGKKVEYSEVTVEHILEVLKQQIKITSAVGMLSMFNKDGELSVHDYTGELSLEDE